MLEDEEDPEGLNEETGNNFCCELVFMPLAIWLVVFILPGLYMVHVAGWYPTPPLCEHDLAMLLEFKGYMCMVTGFCGLIFTIVYEGHFRSLMQVAGMVGMVVVVIENLVA